MPRYQATNPDGIHKKILECRFFFDQMAAYERSKNIDCFMFCLSAFLSSFRTALYRLNGVIHTRVGKPAAKEQWLALEKSEGDLWFLKMPLIWKFMGTARLYGPVIK